MTKAEEFLQRLILQGIQLWPQNGNLRYAGPEGRITTALLTQLKEQKAALLQLLEQVTAAPTSYGQRSLWVIHQQAPDNAAYNVSLAYRIHSALDVELLRDTVQLLVNRHAALRTRFTWQADTVVQQIDGYQAAAITILDVGACAPAALGEQVRLLHEQPFDLQTGPLFRTTILRHSDQQYSLLLTVHHIVIDGWSLYQLIDELFTLYDALRHGAVAALPLLQYTYADYAAWQQTLLATDGARLGAYWQAQLGGPLPVLQLPTDYPRPPVQLLRGLSQPIHLARPLTEQLKRVARQHGCTLYMVLLAAYQTLLHRYSGQEDLVVGLPMAARSRPEFAEIIGYFTSSVVVRVDLQGNPTFAQLLAQVKGQVLAALDHQDYPFIRLVEDLKPPRDPSRSPIYQASFVLQKPHRAQELVLQPNQRTQAGFVLEPIPVTLFGGQDDIALELIETSAELLGYFKADAGLFTQATLARIAGHFQVLLAELVAGPERVHCPLGELPLLTAAERQQMLVAWNETATVYPKDKGVHQLFEEQVARTPEAVALVMVAEDRGQGTANGHLVTPSLLHSRTPATGLTYRELNARANQLAHYLRSLGVGSPGGADVLVGIYVERSLAMMVGLLGILKAGGAYVPLDPNYPPERLALMIEDAAPPVLLTQAHLVHQLPTTGAHVVCLDQDAEVLAGQCAENPPNVVQADHLAYVIYTSGSTGKPKGVQIRHGALTNLMCAMQQQPGMDAEDVLLTMTTLSFDMAVPELYLALVTGAKMVMVSRDVATDGERLYQTLVDAQITIMQGTPATWQMLLAAGWQGTAPGGAQPGARFKLLCGGEALPPALAATLLPRCSELWNLYGPTETTVWSTMQRITSDQLITVGRPIANTQAYILNAQRQPVPIGVVGELYLGGDGMARGYLNRPELTEEKFIPNPFGPGRLCKTGDLARWLPDGVIECLGRIDHQVKVRGFRIELGEIETALRQHPAVQEAVVVARKATSSTDLHGSQLVAYLVPTPPNAVNAQGTSGPESLSPDYRSYLHGKLPEYMVPNAFVVLEALPLNPNGKVDRKLLPAPDLAALATKATFAPPSTPTERALAAIWSEVLGVERIGSQDNFFELGGHSLLATQILVRLRHTHDVDLSLRQFFQMPTIGALADYLDSAQVLQTMRLTVEQQLVKERSDRPKRRV